MSNRPKVLSSVVDNDLCIGCGLCTYKCPTEALKMHWNEFGFLVPEAIGDCCNTGSCLTVCPFNPDEKDSNKNETGLGKIFLTDTTQSHEKLGRFVGIYAGHSHKYRPTSSSGGIASYVFEKLLDQNIVDHIISVGQAKNSDTHYEYMVKSTKEELKSVSKTKYFPVTLATILPQINALEGKVAVVGVACFVKAIRLAQTDDSFLKEKIPFVAGIICGGVKSRFFTEYLASKAGATSSFRDPEYRVKDANSTASDYAFKCTDNNDPKLIKMKSVGDMWGTGLFKANACDFCDDVTTELADISLGDAWLEPYNNDGEGTNVVVTRSLLADKIINDGILNGDLDIEKLTLHSMLASQQGSFNHRHDGLYSRLKENKNNNVPTPPKRFGKKRLAPDLLLVQKFRRTARQQSLDAWKELRSADTFDESMKKTLLVLRLATRTAHYRRALIRKIKGLIK